jgi:hypothetical protein
MQKQTARQLIASRASGDGVEKQARRFTPAGFPCLD